MCCWWENWFSHCGYLLTYNTPFLGIYIYSIKHPTSKFHMELKSSKYLTCDFHMKVKKVANIQILDFNNVDHVLESNLEPSWPSGWFFAPSLCFFLTCLGFENVGNNIKPSFLFLMSWIWGRWKVVINVAPLFIIAT